MDSIVFFFPFHSFLWCRNVTNTYVHINITGEIFYVSLGRRKPTIIIFHWHVILTILYKTKTAEAFKAYIVNGTYNDDF